MKSSRLKAHMEVARAYSKLSHAKRLKVGTVLLRDDRPISVGYNGCPSGGSNVCEVLIKDKDDPFPEWETKKEVIHAEANSILFAAKNGISTNGCVMVSTHSPCYECAKMIIQSGINEVYYENEYRVTDSIKFLIENGVKCVKV